MLYECFLKICREILKICHEILKICREILKICREILKICREISISIKILQEKRVVSWRPSYINDNTALSSS